MRNDYVYFGKMKLLYRDILQSILNAIVLVLMTIMVFKYLAAIRNILFHMDGYNVASKVACFLFRSLFYGAGCEIMWEIIKALSLKREDVRAEFNKFRHILSVILNIVSHREMQNLVTTQVPELIWTAIALGVLSWGDLVTWIITIYLICGIIWAISRLVFNPKKMLRSYEREVMNMELLLLPMKRTLYTILEILQ